MTITHFDSTFLIDSQGLPFVVFVVNHLFNAPLKGTMSPILVS